MFRGDEEVSVEEEVSLDVAKTHYNEWQKYSGVKIEDQLTTDQFKIMWEKQTARKGSTFEAFKGKGS